MSDTILGGDLTVYYLSENRQKRIAWTGAATDTRTMTEVYDAAMDLFDESLQMDDGSPFDYDTPTEFKVGNIDAGSLDAWFMGLDTVEHITGASLKTVGWTRVEGAGTNVGIVRMGYTETVGLVPGDIGLDVLMTVDGDRGTLLDYNDVALEMWIRPDTSAAANSFDDTTPNGAWTIVTGTGTGNQAGGAAVSGEGIWAGYETIGTVNGLADTHFFAEQAGAQVVAYKGTDDWWTDGHIDPLIPVQIMDVVTDEGVVKWHARQFTKTHGFFQVTDTVGVKNPVPFGTGDDTGNESGYAQTVTTDAANGPFVVGEVIGNNVVRASATKLGIVTSVSGTEPNVTLQYYLIGDLTAFVNSDVLEGYTSSADATVVTPTNVNAATYSDITYTFTADGTLDIDADDTLENYAIVIDLNNRTLTQMHERNQYLCRRGETATLDGQEGQFYIGLEWKFNYTAEVGSVPEGSVVTQVTTGAVGTVVSHDATANLVSLRTTRGTFSTVDNVELDGSNRYTQPLTNLVQIAPKGATTGTPFGNAAGASFFGAYGVALTTVASADANNYTLTDLDGNLIEEPLSVTLAVTNSRVNDRIAVWRLTTAGGVIDTTEYTSDTGNNAGDLTLVVDASIDASVVGKTTGGIVFVLDTSSGYSERYRYTSWTSQTFTLFGNASRTDDGTGTQTTIDDASENFVTDGVLVGDIVYNSTDSTYAYVTVVAATQLTLSNDGSENPVASWAGDNYIVGGLAKTYLVSDTVYVPFIHVLEDTGTDGSPGSETASVVYSTDIPVRVVARNKGDIKPFSTDSTIQSTGANVAVIRTDDAVAT